MSPEVTPGKVEPLLRNNALSHSSYRPALPMSLSPVRLFAVTALVGGAFILSSPGYAQDHVRAEGAKACGPDATRLCKHVLDQGDMVMLRCFKNRASKLAPSCRTFLKKVGQLK